MKLVAYAHLLRAAVRIVRDPSKLDEVFVIAGRLKDVNRKDLEAVATFARAYPDGARALASRERLALDLATLEQLPVGSLGRMHAAMLRERGLDPADIPTLAADDEPSFVQAHLYETHDLWHTLTGFDVDVAGELGLQGFYAAQLPGTLPITLLTLGLLNTLLFAFGDRRRRLEAIATGWRMGREARQIFGAPWATWLARPLGELRAELGVVPAPPFDGPALEPAPPPPVSAEAPQLAA